MYLLLGPREPVIDDKLTSGLRPSSPSAGPTRLLESGAPMSGAEHFRRALAELEFVDDRLFTLFKSTINLVFFSPSAALPVGCGQTTLGTVCCDPAPTWTTDDFHEFMVHELARNLLLIDERAGSYYRNPAFLADPRAVVPSPFSAVRQRFDCALPQLIIALEILLFRWRSGRVLVNPQLYPDFNCLLDKATATCAAMMAVDAHLSLLSARGADLLQAAKRAVVALQRVHKSSEAARHGPS